MASTMWFVVDLLYVLELLIIADVLVSWAILLRIGNVRDSTSWVRTLRRVTEPILNPIRRMMPAGGACRVDFSPLVALVGIQIAQQLLLSVG